MKENIDIHVSIIVPFYNSEKTIERCIKSVISQSYREFELILVDDCGEDTAAELARGYSENDSRVKLFTHEINRGVSSARNTGLSVCRGTHVMFLDSDDYIMPTYLEKMVESGLNVDLVSSSFSIQEDFSTPNLRNHGVVRDQIFGQRELSFYIEQYFYKPYVYTMLVHCWNKLYVAETIRRNGLKFNEDLSQLEDVHFVARYLNYVDSMKFCDVPGYIQVRESGGLNLSIFSGLGGKKVVEDSLGALAPIGELKNKLDKKFEHNDTSSYSHFLSSMAVLFCLRMARRFWVAPSTSVLTSINAWVNSDKLRPHFCLYKRVEGESTILRFSIRKLPAFVSIFLFVMVGRKR